MQPLSSDSDLDLAPSPRYLPSLYLRSPRIRRLYDALRDDAVPLIACSRVATNSTSSSSSPRPRSPASPPPPDTPHVPNTCSLDVAPPSDEQLGLPSAVESVIQDIPIAIKPLAMALWNAPQLAVLNGYTRQQVATALGHALNLHRANGHARAVLLLPRVPSYAKVWQQALENVLDEVKLTTVRGTRRLRNNCLNSLRTEQSPGVVILADKSLKHSASMAEIRQALRENRVVNTWDLVISEVHGGDSTLNLFHSPFRMVADKHARAGLFVSCTNEAAKVRRDHFSKHSVRDFIQTQLPSLSSLSDESVWITCASVKRHSVNSKMPTRASVEDPPAVPKKPNRPKSHPTSQKLDQLRRKADALVSEIQRSPPVYRHIPPKEVCKEDIHMSEIVHQVEPMSVGKRVQRSLSMPINASRTRNGTAAGRMPLQENRKTSTAKGEPRTSAAFHSNERVSPSHDITPMRSNETRTRRRSSSRDVRSRRSYDRRSVSIVELSDDDESELEWHTPPSQVIVPSFYPNSSDNDNDNDSSGKEEWKTAYASRRKARMDRGRSVESAAKSRNARMSSEYERQSRGPEDSEFKFPARRGRRTLCALDAGDESPDTFPSTHVLDSEASALDTNTEPRERISDGRRVPRRRRVSKERHHEKRLGPRRSLSADNLRTSEETTRASSPPGTTWRLSCGSSSASNVRDDGFGTPNVRRSVPFVEILDSDVEVVGDHPEVINLCSDSDENGYDAFSPARNINSHRARRISMQRARMHTANNESEDEGDVSYGSSLILTGVTKYNPQPDSLTEPERRKYNTWLRLARRSEARGPEGYDAAIKLYTKCLTLCDEDDHLASRILSLSHETGLLTRRDFPEERKSSRITKRTRLPRRRLRRLCSTDSSS